MKPKFQVNDLVGVPDLKKTFSKGDTTNRSYKLHKITEIFNDTIPNYRFDNLKEIYKASLLRKTDLKLKEIKIVMKKKYHLDQIKRTLTITADRNLFVC